VNSQYEHLIFILILCAHSVGILSALRALYTTRSSQGAIAWIMSMITFPYIAVPLYWVFGRNRFYGYVKARRAGDEEIQELANALNKYRSDFACSLEEKHSPFEVLENLAKLPFTTHNDAKLLVNGTATFDAIFEAMEKAEDYILVQFFIIRDDIVGRELKTRLIQKAQQGLRVYLLYDEIGCHKLPGAYEDELREAGVEVHAFDTTKGWKNRLQINFRNHRKIVVTDGKVAFLGGHNVGDEYMGRSKRFGMWRDTHARFEGPSVSLIQLSFIEDWYWATHEVPELDWTVRPAPSGDMRFLTLPTGPADTLESCNLLFVTAINAAKKRLWIVSPYFVPGEEVLMALQLAALRGVDVRVMLPMKPDHKLVYLASFSYLAELQVLGVKFFRYQPGFLHQKVMLVDDAMASVGTANCDNRSFRLNFEITMVGLDAQFVTDVETMLERDFTQCVEATVEDYERRWFGFKTGVKLARLLSPIL